MLVSAFCLIFAALQPSNALAEIKASASFRVASLNIHYTVDGKIDAKGPAKWDKRRDAVTFALGKIDADIVAFQEMETFAGGKFNLENVQLDWLLATLPDYKAAAIGDPSKFPSTQPIFYKPSRFELVDQGWFYFSDTPDKLFSASFDGGFDHYASTAKLKDRATGLTVSLINVHTDIRSLTNRRGAIEVIGQRVQKLQAQGERVIVLGDFNAISIEPNMRNLVKLGLESTALTLPTYHLGKGLGVWFAIDHILHSKGVERVASATIHRLKLNGVYPSDHFPISADYRLISD
jgi:endonuclease/exonuclease/phosphatase family metal-dependent hydrolase